MVVLWLEIPKRKDVLHDQVLPKILGKMPVVECLSHNDVIANSQSYTSCLSHNVGSGSLSKTGEVLSSLHRAAVSSSVWLTSLSRIIE